MDVILYSYSLFIIFFATHLIVWRFKIPSRQFLSLLVIFFVIYIAFLVFSVVVGFSFLPFFQISLFYLSTGLCYIVLYSAINLDSPTLSLMMYVHEAGSRGRTHDEIRVFLARYPFISSRLDSLISEGTVVSEVNMLKIKKSSRSYDIILLYRRLFGNISKGG